MCRRGIPPFHVKGFLLFSLKCKAEKTLSLFTHPICGEVNRCHACKVKLLHLTSIWGQVISIGSINTTYKSSKPHGPLDCVINMQMRRERSKDTSTADALNRRPRATITIRLFGNQTGGRFVVHEDIVMPGMGPPLHYHTREDERRRGLPRRDRLPRPAPEARAPQRRQRPRHACAARRHVFARGFRRVVSQMRTLKERVFGV